MIERVDNLSDAILKPIKEKKAVQNQQLSVDVRFEVIKDFRQLHRGQKVYLGDACDARIFNL
jgi:ABC-type uncharacterized transport system YnjBCD substrate-binding protein